MNKVARLLLMSAALCADTEASEGVSASIDRDSIVARAIAASNAEVASILGDDVQGFGDLIAADAVIDSLKTESTGVRTP